MLFASMSLSILLGAMAGMAAPVTAATSAPVPAITADINWKAVAASGKVQVHPASMPADLWSQLSRGDAVAPRSQVKTLENGTATLTRQGDLILVAQGSEVVLPETADFNRTTILQKSGKAFYKVAHRPDGKFEVRTPYLVAGVKGTQFSVMIEGQNVSVSVIEGHVEVTSLISGEKQDLFAGHVAMMETGTGHVKVQREGDPGTSSGVKSEDNSRAKEIRKETVRLEKEAVSDLALKPVADGSLWADLSDSPRCPSRDAAAAAGGTSTGATVDAAAGSVTGTVTGVVGTTGSVVGGIVNSTPLDPKRILNPLTARPRP